MPMTGQQVQRLAAMYVPVLLAGIAAAAVDASANMEWKEAVVTLFGLSLTNLETIFSLALISLISGGSISSGNLIANLVAIFALYASPSGFTTTLILHRTWSNDFSPFIVFFLAMQSPYASFVSAVASLRYFNLYPSTDSVTQLFGSWYFFRLFPPFLKYIRGNDTDDNFFADAAMPEYQLYTYLISNGVVWGLYLSGSAMGLIAAILILAVAIWKLLSNDAQQKLVELLLALYGRYVKRFGSEQYSPKGIFLALYDLAWNRIERWEETLAQEARRQLLLRPRYQYQALYYRPGIRLLKLDRRIPFSGPTCSLLHFPLENAPEFEALSYTWGLPPPSFPLSIDGQSLLVTSAVEKFLWNRRSVFGPKYFWIDAVCIDQENALEKSEQLPFMRMIYKRASRVIVWLHRPALPLSHINDLRIALRLLEFESLCGTQAGALFKLHFTPEREDAAMKAIHQLLSHPWFERIWIIQEVARARSVHVIYSGICFDWSCIERAVFSIVGSRPVYAGVSTAAAFQYENRTDQGENAADFTTTSESPLLLNVCLISLIRQRAFEGDDRKMLSLAEVLYLTRADFKATNARDKIYALLGITSNEHQLLKVFTPSYLEKVEVVFLKTTLFLLSTDEWHVILSCAGRGYSEQLPGSAAASLPSWVPDWEGSRNPGIRALPSTWLDGSGRTKDDKGKVVIFATSPRIIHLLGFKLDSLSHVGPGTGRFFKKNIFPGYDGPDDAPLDHQRLERLYAAVRGTLPDWYRQSRELARKFSAASERGEESVDEEFWHVCMSESLDKTPEYLAWTRDVFEEWLLSESKELVRMMLEKPSTYHNVKNLSAIMNGNFARSITGKAFAVTESGAMALVPPLSKEGDILCYFRGACMPFVMRSKRDGVYELIGNCYVHGVADVVKDVEWERYSLE